VACENGTVLTTPMLKPFSFMRISAMVFIAPPEGSPGARRWRPKLNRWPQGHGMFFSKCNAGESRQNCKGPHYNQCIDKNVFLNVFIFLLYSLKVFLILINTGKNYKILPPHNNLTPR